MFYDRFIELCNEKGIKPTPLLVSLKLSRSNGKYWKDGGLPDTTSLITLADYFGVSIDFLLDRVKERNSNAPEAIALEASDDEIYNLCISLPEGDRQDLVQYAAFLKTKHNQ